jgi:hypothetical protein
MNYKNTSKHFFYIKDLIEEIHRKC